MKTIRLIELFAGYGSQAMALKRLGLPFEHHFVCEFDKFAIASYNAVHGTDFKPIDVKNVRAADLNISDREDYTYLLTYSFPCTDLSIGGKMQGMAKGTGTRSGLLWEVERILRECGDNLPHFLMMENVTQVHGKTNISDFNDWISFLDSLGYKSKWQDLSAKDYGVAQYRDRCFMISWLESKFCYQFPDPIPLTKTMNDYLDDEVDERYFLNTEKAESFLKKLEASGKIEQDVESDKINVLGLLENKFTYNARIYDSRGQSPAILSRDYKEPRKIVVVDKTAPICLNARVDGVQPMIGDRVYSTEGVACTIAATRFSNPRYLMKNRIRKLTEIECLRLMGVSDEDASKIRSVNSARQTYKQAGNSIVVDVMVAIFDNLFNKQGQMSGQMSIYDYL